MHSSTVATPTRATTCTRTAGDCNVRTTARNAHAIADTASCSVAVVVRSIWSATAAKDTNATRSASEARELTRS